MASRNVLSAIAAIAFAQGCLQSNLDESWGQSYEAQVTLQTADPAAPATTEPPEGLDPETGKRVAERYYEGQTKQGHREAKTVVIGDL